MHTSSSTLRSQASRATKDIESLLRRIKSHRSDKPKESDPPVPPQAPETIHEISEEPKEHHDYDSDDSVKREVDILKHQLGIVRHSSNLKENLQMIKRELTKVLLDREEDEEKCVMLQVEVKKQLAVIMSLEQTQDQHQTKLLQLTHDIETKSDELLQSKLSLQSNITINSAERDLMATSLKEALTTLELTRSENLTLMREQSRNKEMSDKLQETNQAEITRLKELLELLNLGHEQKLEQLQQYISEKEQQLEDFKQQSAENQENLQAGSEQLRTELDQAIEMNRRLTQEANITKKKLEELLELQKGVKANILKIEKLEKQILEKDVTIQELVLKLAGTKENSVSQMETLRDQVSTQNVKHSEAIKEKDDTIAELKRSLSWSKRTESELLARLDDMQGACDALALEEEKHAETRQGLSQMGLDLLKLTSEYRNVANELEELRNQLTDKDTQIAQLTTKSESQKRLLEADLKTLQDTVAMQTQRIASEQLVTHQLRRILSKKVDKLADNQSNPSNQAVEFPAINIHRVPDAESQASSKVDKKQSGRSFFSDSPKHWNEPNKTEDATETEVTLAQVSSPTEEGKQRNQLMTIQALSRKLQTLEREREEETKSLRDEASAARERFEQQIQLLQHENIELKGLIVKLSVPVLPEEDPDDECRKKLKLLATTLQNLHAVADQEEATKNELIEKVMTLIKVIDRLKQSICEMEIKLLANEPVLVSTPMPRSRRNTIQSKSTVDIGCQYGEEEEPTPVESPPADFTPTKESPFRKSESIMMTDSVVVERLKFSTGRKRTSGVISPAQLQNSLRHNRTDTEQQTQHITFAEKSVSFGAVVETSNSAQQTQLLTSETEIQVQSDSKLTLHIEQQTISVTTTDQMQQAKPPLPDLTSQQTIDITISTPPEVCDNHQQTDAAFTHEKDLQTERAHNLDEAQQTDTVAVECTPIQTVETIESINSEKLAQSNRIKQLEDAMQANSTHYLRLVEALNEEIAFLKDASRTSDF